MARVGGGLIPTHSLTRFFLFWGVVIYSSVFQLPEGRMLSYFGIVPHDHVLDVPNAALGLIYYSIWLLVMPSLPKKLTLLVSSLAMTSSVFLAIQLLILKELCLLCWSTHVINSRLFFSAVATALFSSSSTKKDDGKAKVKRV